MLGRDFEEGSEGASEALQAVNIISIAKNQALRQAVTGAPNAATETVALGSKEAEQIILAPLAHPAFQRLASKESLSLQGLGFWSELGDWTKNFKSEWRSLSTARNHIPDGKHQKVRS